MMCGSYFYELSYFIVPHSAIYHELIMYANRALNFKNETKKHHLHVSDSFTKLS